MKFEGPRHNNDNVPTDPEAKNLLKDTGQLIEEFRKRLHGEMENLRGKLANLHGDSKSSEIIDTHVQLARITSIEGACVEAERRRLVFLTEPDDDTLHDAQGLHDEIKALIARYESEQ